MTHEPLLEEGERADALGPVDNLVGDNKVHGLDLLAEGADGGEGDDAADTYGPQRSDVSARGHLMWRELVVDAVTGQEGHGDAIVPSDEDGRRREAPGRLGVDGSYGLEAGDSAQASPADDGDVDGFCERSLDRILQVGSGPGAPWGWLPLKVAVSSAMAEQKSSAATSCLDVEAVADINVGFCQTKKRKRKYAVKWRCTPAEH